jgi:hypothetical protein
VAGRGNGLAWRQDERIDPAVAMLAWVDIQAEASSDQLSLKCKKDTAWQHKLGIIHVHNLTKPGWRIHYTLLQGTFGRCM